MINFKTFQSEDNNKLKTKDQYSRNSCLFASRTNADETTCFVLCYDVLYDSMHIRFRGLGCASNSVRSFLNGRNQKCFANTPVKQVTHDRRNPLVCTLIIQLILECTHQVVSLKDCVWFWSFETCSRLFSNHSVAVYF